MYYFFSFCFFSRYWKLMIRISRIIENRVIIARMSNNIFAFVLIPETKNKINIYTDRKPFIEASKNRSRLNAGGRPPNSLMPFRMADQEYTRKKVITNNQRIASSDCVPPCLKNSLAGYKKKRMPRIIRIIPNIF